MVRPKLKHWRLQNRLADLLRPLGGPSYVVGIELAFRALPEHELRDADVAVIPGLVLTLPGRMLIFGVGLNW